MGEGLEKLETKKNYLSQWNEQGVINVLQTIMKTVNYENNSFGRKLETKKEEAQCIFSPRFFLGYFIN